MSHAGNHFQKEHVPALTTLAAHGTLSQGSEFIHESIIGTLFDGRVEATAKVGNRAAIIPSISGWARLHGINTIFVNQRDPLRAAFIV